MAITAAILNYHRFLKRRNYSGHTIKNYMHTLKQFVVWVNVPIEEVNHKKLLAYLDHLLDRGLQPKTINCHLDSIRGFYHYLIEEEQVAMVNPVKRGYALRLSRPLPRHLRDEEVDRLLQVVQHQRDRAMVMLMLRCGAFKNGWSITPARRASKCHATNCGTPWLPSSSMPTLPW
jgi:site-specific recombinase XerD